MEGAPASFDLFYKHTYPTNGGFMFDVTITFQVGAGSSATGRACCVEGVRVDVRWCGHARGRSAEGAALHLVARVVLQRRAADPPRPHTRTLLPPGQGDDAPRDCGATLL